jgi:phosphate acetyltransferase
MQFIGTVIEKLQRHPKRIVFPEGTEPRVIQAARQFHCLSLGAPILLGQRTRIEAVAAGIKVSLEGIRIIDPERSEDLETFARTFRLLRRPRGMKTMEARDAMLNPNFYGAMMVAMHQADGLVTGTNVATTAVLRPLIQTIRLAPHISTAAACTVMEFENPQLGEEGVMVLADVAVVPEPTMEQLADIAVSTARFARQLFGFRPRVAFLSYATKDPATPPAVGKVQAAVALAEQKAHQGKLEADFDGELQADTALVPEIAARKLPDSKVAGRANVLIFPELSSANIAYKLLRNLARASAYGHLLLGLDRPAADVSRGSTAHDILGVAALVGVQAIGYEQLYPGAGQPLPTP